MADFVADGDSSAPVSSVINPPPTHTVFPMATLPIELCVTVSTFLTFEDWQKFLNCSKIVEPIRKATRYILLNMTAGNKYCTDPAFHELVNSRIRDSRRQLCLALHNISDPQILSKAQGVHRLILSYCNLPSLKGIVTNVRELTLLFCDALTEIDPSPDTLKKVDAYMCGSIHEFSQFSHVQSLRICENKELRDLSPLRDVSHLTLMNCSALSDLSGLAGGRIHTLILVNCQAVVDVSPLQHLQHVEINGCHAINNFQTLREVPTLSIEYCRNAHEQQLRMAFGENKKFHFLAYKDS